MIVKLLTDQHLEFLSLKGGCPGSPESTLIKMPHCLKSHAAAQTLLSFQLQSASLLFVDNPVGTGFSYVDHESALTTNVSQIAIDMVVLLKTIFNNKLADFQVTKMSLFLPSIC